MAHRVARSQDKKLLRFIERHQDAFLRNVRPVIERPHCLVRTPHFKADIVCVGIIPGEPISESGCVERKAWRIQRRALFRWQWFWLWWQ